MSRREVRALCAVLALALSGASAWAAATFDSNTFGGLRARSLGPATMSGRIAAVDAVGITEQAGIFFVLFCLVTVVWSDAGAYFAGHAWGKRKLAPRISPGKTVEGAIGGVVGGTVAGLLTKGIFDVFWPELSQALAWGPAVVMGLVVASVAIVGDLAESLMKRDAQTKDAGSLLPGMGGILDRIDSPLLGVPVMYYMLLFYVFLMVESR